MEDEQAHKYVLNVTEYTSSTIFGINS